MKALNQFDSPANRSDPSAARTGLLDRLVDEQILTAEQGSLILQQQHHLSRVVSDVSALGFQQGLDIKDLLLEAGFVTKADLMKTLDSMGVGLTADMQALLPREICHRYQVIPVRQTGLDLVIASATVIGEAELLDLTLAASVFNGAEVTISVVASPQSVIDLGLKRLAGNSNGVADALRALEKEDENGWLLKTLIHELLMESIGMGASDAHFEYVADRPERCYVSYRIDGIKKRMHLLSPKIMISVLRTLKMRAGLDASDVRRFQDGRADFQYQNRQIDLRVHSNAMSGGEYLVIRFLDRESLRSLHDLMPYHTEITNELKRLTHSKSKESGVLLVTGPTGSGKTTTLYAVIMAMERHLLNVMTIEDPVEFDLPFVEQLWFNASLYESFADVLPSVLRSDPDVVVLGELRDEETAMSAMRFAESGHLMMSTLHANDSWQSYERFINMMNPATRHIGISTFAHTVKAILNQILLRKLCQACALPMPAVLATEAEKWFGESGRYARMVNPQGCKLCNAGFAAGRLCLPEAIFFNTSSEARSKLSRVLLGGSDLHDALSDDPSLGRAYTRRTTLMPLVQAGLVDIRNALDIVGANDAGAA